MRPQGFEALWSRDRAAQNAAYAAILPMAEAPLDWAYEVWDEVVARLASADNHDRAIAGQLLPRLALSDPEGRIVGDLPRLMAVTDDEKFVTARHTIQSLWRIGLAGEAARTALLAAVERRFADCASHRNATLIRHDLLDGLRKLADATEDKAIRPLAERLIASEPDEKYRKKYKTLWR
ncbi:hypothetical protein [Devosia sp. CAU 1758]